VGGAEGAVGAGEVGHVLVERAVGVALGDAGLVDGALGAAGGAADTLDGDAVAVGTVDEAETGVVADGAGFGHGCFEYRSLGGLRLL